MTDRPHITLPEIARLLRVPYRRAYELLLTGEYKGEKIAGQWHIDSESFERFVERHAPLANDGNR